MVKVSVIIPVYNSEKYLDKCLQSVVNQTLKDIEIICINDGSTDNSEEILEMYKNSDARVKVILQTNKKQGAARNEGLKIASGEYIGFVDSDDWIDLDFYEKLYDAAKKYNADIALAKNIRVKERIKKNRLNITAEKVFTTLQEKLDINRQWKNPCPVNKLYRHAFLLNHDIKWTEGVYCEDKLYTLKAIYYADKIVTVPGISYYYYKNPTSTVNNREPLHYKKIKDDKDSANRAVLNFLKAKNAKIRDKDFWAITDETKILGITVLKTKESLKTKRICLFGVVPILQNVLN